MSKALILLAAVISLGSLAIPATAQAQPVAEAVTPPAIYVPAGGKVVTEINISDDDVLGIIKQSIPAIADAAKTVVPAHSGGGDEASMIAACITAADVNGLVEAIEGIKNVRVLVVRYPGKIAPEDFIAQVGAGAAKAGPFHKILSDYGTFPGALAVYALPDNAGSMAFLYEPREKTAYAARVVGGLDVPKLIKWAGNLVKVIQMRQEGPAPTAIAPADVTAPSPAVEAK